MDDPITFRKEAEKCRGQAAQAFDPLDKAFWLELAENWDRMAENPSAPDRYKRAAEAASLKQLRF